MPGALTRASTGAVEAREQAPILALRGVGKMLLGEIGSEQTFSMLFASHLLPKVFQESFSLS